MRIIQGGRRGRRIRRGEARLAALVFAIVLALGILIERTGAFARQEEPSSAERSVEAPPQTSLRVIDGDTFEVRGSQERIRLANIDTPEMGERARCDSERRAAERATNEARRQIGAARRIEVRRTGRTDRYGRTIGFVVLDGQDLGEALIASGHARPWRGRREPWCAADGRSLR